MVCVFLFWALKKKLLRHLDTTDPEILFEAVCAAGSNKVDMAWKKIIEIASNKSTEENLLFAAISSAFDINADEAGRILSDPFTHKDQDIIDFVNECLALSETYDEYSEFDDEEPLH